MYTFRDKFDIRRKVGTYEEYCKLADSLNKFPNSLCYCSTNLVTKEDI